MVKIKHIKFRRIGNSRGFIIPLALDATTLKNGPILGNYYDIDIQETTNAHHD